PVGEGGEIAEYPVELIPSDKIDDDTAAAISEVSLTAQGVKIKLLDKQAALEKLLRHLSDGGGGDDEPPTLNININSDAPVKEVRVTRSDG
ncbi:MAG: terminase small subunit, partial [Pikeienuella sp.]